MRAVDLDSATAGRQNATADGTALLQETCHWLPAANEEAYSRLPVPTRALVEALTEHLEQHLARPKVRASSGVQIKITNKPCKIVA